MMQKNSNLNKREIQSIFLKNTLSFYSERYYGDEFRQVTMKHSYPEYLLSSEFNTLLFYAHNEWDSSLISTLWNTGASLYECLCLKRKSFVLKAPNQCVKLPVACENGESQAIRYKNTKVRIVPLLSKQYIHQMKSILECKRLENAGRLEQCEKIWSIEEQVGLSWIDKLVKRATADGIFFKVEITPDSIRHSFAMNMLIKGVEPSVVLKLMGFHGGELLDVYMKVNDLMNRLITE